LQKIAFHLTGSPRGVPDPRIGFKPTRAQTVPCEDVMNNIHAMSTIVLIILILLLISVLPTWPYSSGWGYYPSGGLGLVLLIVLILVLLRVF
jgi:hypothetical protein